VTGNVNPTPGIGEAALCHHFCRQAEQRRASAVLQGTMLVAAKLSEDERDNLIQRHMVMTQSLTQKVSLLPPYLLYIGNI
jgi:hypothetical protein